MIPDWNNAEDVYTANSQWSLATATQADVQELQNAYPEHTPTPAQSPWNSESAQDNVYGANATTGCVAFEPPPGAPFETFRIREEYLQNSLPIPEVFGTEPISPSGDGESEGWDVVASYPASTIRSYDSPRSQDSPWSLVNSPPPSSSSPQQSNETHSHVFSAYPGEPKTAAPRGRQRALTVQEKQEALVVRKAKACWACHLSKIKVMSFLCL